MWPNRLELKGWGSVTLTGELAMGDVDIQIDGPEPPGSEESYLPEESRNSSAIESFCVNAPFLITVSLGGHYRRKRVGRQASSVSL